MAAVTTTPTYHCQVVLLLEPIKSFKELKTIESKKSGVDMELLPNLSVALTADMYTEAAYLLNEKSLESNNASLAWVACINATLASEIYIKSFLAHNVITQIDSETYAGSHATVKGHNLVDLYNQIPDSLKQIILSESNSLRPNFNVAETIKHCKDYFLKARYPHEPKSSIGLNSCVIELANHMNELVKRVAEINHPKIIKKPRLKIMNKLTYLRQ